MISGTTSWYIAAHVWKIYDFKIEVIPFIINFSTELTTVLCKIVRSSVILLLPLINDMDEFQKFKFLLSSNDLDICKMG
jgi:abortive infection bacteriophage resistance protein